MAELRPCPACGGEAHTYSDGWRVWWGVQCNNCLHKTQEFRREKEAIDAWNGSDDNA